MTRPTTTSRPEGIDPSYERELVRQAASTRRAIVLGSLTVILLGALVAAMLGMLPRWAPIVAAVPVVAFVIAAAMTSSQRSASKATSKTAPQRSATTAPRRERPARAESKAAAAAAADRSSATAQSDEDWENWNAWDDDESWDAVPTTLPTYVTAPRASAIPRGIDRSRPGEWTGSAMVETAQAMRARPQADALRDSAELIDHGADTAEIPVVPDSYGARRAVNE